ncbi:MAG: hypothetical protein LBT01_05835 [Spirochaetaceae bacterium]|jgi:hypothetical protein|nr:hypothetical protein [Spirochaetaceae bacterium]
MRIFLPPQAVPEALSALPLVREGRFIHFCGFFAALPLLAALVVFFALASPAFAQNEGKIALSIRYYDKKIYHVGDENPINVQITISNNSTGLYHFRLADDRVFSIDVDTRTLSNRTVESAETLKRKRATAGKVFFRDIVIESGESFSFVENLHDYANISAAGDYVVQLRLYPELLNADSRHNAAAGSGGAENQQAILTSNRIPLHIKPIPLTGEDGLPVALDIETNAILVRERIAPDQVVDWTLSARQKSQWERFFLYLDLEKMIARDGARQRRWRAESEEGRLRMLADYRAEMQKSTIDGDISSISMDWTIEQTSYDYNEGRVVVLERFKVGGYTERKRFTYYLEKEDGYWRIVDYVVVNRGSG